jgi:hypothetical protein
MRNKGKNALQVQILDASSFLDMASHVCHLSGLVRERQRAPRERLDTKPSHLLLLTCLVSSNEHHTSASTRNLTKTPLTERELRIQQQVCIKLANTWIACYACCVGLYWLQVRHWLCVNSSGAV